MYPLYRSFYSSSRFADIPIPPTEDWESATGMVSQNGVLYYAVLWWMFLLRMVQHFI